MNAGGPKQGTFTILGLRGRIVLQFECLCLQFECLCLPPTPKFIQRNPSFQR